jgi:hypothetical protein
MKHPRSGSLITYGSAFLRIIFRPREYRKSDLSLCDQKTPRTYAVASLVESLKTFRHRRVVDVPRGRATCTARLLPMTRARSLVVSPPDLERSRFLRFFVPPSAECLIESIICTLAHAPPSPIHQTIPNTSLAPAIEPTVSRRMRP